MSLAQGPNGRAGNGKRARAWAPVEVDLGAADGAQGRRTKVPTDRGRSSRQRRAQGTDARGRVPEATREGGLRLAVE